MRTDKLKRLLNGIKEWPGTTEKAMTCEQFGKWVYSSEIGKKIIDELKEGGVNAEELRKKGFIAAEMSIGWILSQK